MDYEKYNNALEKAKARYNEIKDTNCGEKEFLLELFPELKKSEDERIRKDIMILVKDWWDRVNKDNISTKEQMIAWLEKQKEIDKEIVFRPLAGTDIITAARQALEKIEIGKEVILAFNGAYIPVNGKTVAEICNEYFAWTEKQGEQKVPSVEFKAKDWYVSNVDGKIHNANIGSKKQGEEKSKDETKNNSENYCEDCINRKGCINCENGNLKETISLDSCEKQDEQDFSHNVDDEIRNELYDFIYITTFQPKDLKKKERFLDWIEKQSQKSTWNEEDERLRNSCIEHIEEELEEIGKDKFGHSEIISDLKESCRERINWLKSLKKDWFEKQSERKSKEEIKTTAYNTSDSDVIEYVYILDYCSGRVIVAKYDVRETIETLFKKLGLKESQCHYMVSSDVLSIEYINF